MRATRCIDVRFNNENKRIHTLLPFVISELRTLWVSIESFHILIVLSSVAHCVAG